MNWFQENIGNGRCVTPRDINKRPRQYRVWSGKTFSYPVNEGAPKKLPYKDKPLSDRLSLK